MSLPTSPSQPAPEPFCWENLLRIAEHLHDPERIPLPANRDALYRSAVSRAYYAVYCTLREYAIKNYRFVPRGEAVDHDKLVYQLRTSGKFQKYTDLIHDMRRYRNKCDYDNTVERSLLNLSLTTINLAQTLINLTK